MIRKNINIDFWMHDYLKRFSSRVRRSESHVLRIIIAEFMVVVAEALGIKTKFSTGDLKRLIARLNRGELSRKEQDEFFDAFLHNGRNIVEERMKILPPAKEGNRGLS